MTSTSVRDVGNVANLFPQSSVSSAKSAGSGFAQVLNSHTDRENGTKTEISERNPVKGEDSRRTGEVLRRESGRTELKEKSEAVGTKAADGGELSREELEKAMEVLGSAAAQLLEEIAQLFGLSQEELQGMLDQLGMKQLEVLNPEKLLGLLLQAGGAEDSFSLLTNAELYENYKAVLDRLDTLLQQAGSELGMEGEQLAALVEEAGAADGVTAEEPLLQEELSWENPAAEPDTAEKADVKDSPEEGFLAKTEPSGGASEPDALSKNGGESRNAGEEQTESRTEQGKHGNLLLQNLRENAFQGQIQQTAAGSVSVWDSDTRDIMRQILDYMKIRMNPEETTLEMQLHPESLGTVHVQVASKGGALTAHFVTENEAVKSALESQMIQLKESFHEQGVKVEAIEVTVQAHEFERSFDESRGGRQEADSRKPGARRINLNEPLNLEEMDAEEILAAEVMSAQGSTVNFTA